MGSNYKEILKANIDAGGSVWHQVTDGYYVNRELRWPGIGYEGKKVRYCDFIVEDKSAKRFGENGE